MTRRTSIEGQLSLFPEEIEEAPPFVGLQGNWPDGLWVGTSSWSFPGWTGLVYAQKYSESRLSREGLQWYAQNRLLNAVGIDRTFYAPMASHEYQHYADLVPAGFRFLVKAPERLTTLRFARHPRYGALAGQDNPDFLCARIAQAEWVEPALAGLKDKLGCLLLQFPPMPLGAVGGAAGFAVRLHDFLEKLPVGPTYVVEVRNRELLSNAYWQVLQRLGACHCLNVHPQMPSLSAQSVGLEVSPMLVIRWMLGLGNHDEAVERYQPFHQLVDEDLATRASLVGLWRQALQAQKPIMTIVNNKAEGCAPLSIERLYQEYHAPEVPF